MDLVGLVGGAGGGIIGLGCFIWFVIVPILRNVAGPKKIVALIGGQIGKNDDDTCVMGAWRGHQVRVTLKAYDLLEFEMLLTDGAAPAVGRWGLKYDEKAVERARQQGVWAQQDGSAKYYFVNPHLYPNVVLDDCDDAAKFEQLPEPLRAGLAQLIQATHVASFFLHNSKIMTLGPPTSASQETLTQHLEVMAQVASFYESRAGAAQPPQQGYYRQG